MNDDMVAEVLLGALVYFIVLVAVLLPRPGGRVRHRRDRTVGAR